MAKTLGPAQTLAEEIKLLEIKEREERDRRQLVEMIQATKDYSKTFREGFNLAPGDVNRGIMANGIPAPDPKPSQQKSPYGATLPPFDPNAPLETVAVARHLHTMTQQLIDFQEAFDREILALRNEGVRHIKAEQRLGEAQKDLGQTLTRELEDHDQKIAQLTKLADKQAEVTRQLAQNISTVVESLERIGDVSKGTLDKLLDRMDLAEADILALERKAR